MNRHVSLGSQLVSQQRRSSQQTAACLGAGRLHPPSTHRKARGADATPPWLCRRRLLPRRRARRSRRSRRRLSLPPYPAASAAARVSRGVDIACGASDAPAAVAMPLPLHGGGICCRDTACVAQHMQRPVSAIRIQNPESSCPPPWEWDGHVQNPESRI